MSHIAIKLNGVYLATGENTEIDLEDANPYFNDQSETMSLPFTVPLDGNRAAFGNVECIENDDNLRSIENMRMDVEVDGILLRSGKAGSIEDQSLTDSVALQMVSAVFSLDDYLDGVRCRDVELIDEIPIGETISNVTFNFTCNLQVIMHTIGFTVENGFRRPIAKEHIIDSRDVPPEFQTVLTFPAIGFSQPGICLTKGGSAGYGDSSPYDSDGAIGKPATMVKSYINVTDGYGENGAKYCNARICYMNYKENDGKTTDEVDEEEPYMVLDANRPASGLCFYILYFLDCLFARFKEDGIAYDNSDLMKVEDMRRLAFFTTHCKFRTEPQAASTAPSPLLRNIKQINSWLHTRNIDTTLSVDDSERTKLIDVIKIDDIEYRRGDPSPFWEKGGMPGEKWQQEVGAMYYKYTDLAYSVTADPAIMYATSQNFPDTDAKTVLDSLFNSFGIRFYLDQQNRVVKPRFLRDIFRSQEEAIVFPCRVITATPATEKITGVRMAYSNQSDKQTRQDNITLGLTDYETTYDYEDYRNLYLNIDYADIIKQDYDTNMTLYCDFNTGNLYRVKIDSEAETRSEYHPVIFGVGQLHGVEIGDCSERNSEFVTELISSFEPLVWNDVNYRNERKGVKTTYSMKNEDGQVMRVELETGATKKQILAAFINEKMEHEYLVRSVSYPAGTKHIQLNLLAESKTQENFDAIESPLQTLDWGLAIALMRGGGASAHIDYYDYNYDMFGNCKYRMVAGSDYGMSLDSLDDYGTVYDYNGNLPGIGSGDENITPAQAASSIRRIFSSSNANLMSEARKLDASNVQSVILNDIDGENYGYLMTTVKDDGTVLSATEFSDYINFLGEFSRAHNINIMALDGTLQDFKLIIGKYKDSIVASEYRELLLQLANVYYSGEPGKITCPIPEGESIDYNSSADGRISLKIRSYIEAPEDMIGPHGEEIKKGTPLCDPKVMNRGLFDQFMSEYAYFLLHRKKIQLEIKCDAAALTNIQWHRRYRFGDYVGWINKIKTHITAEKGIESVTVELLVL